jgi:FtsP/CotA-like multicopper oxidase with cupredoxin domain
LVTYDGTIPGPTWRIKPCDHVQVRLINNMTPAASAAATVNLHPEPGDAVKGDAFEIETPSSLFTNLHVHGLQVDPHRPA